MSFESASIAVQVQTSPWPHLPFFSAGTFFLDEIWLEKTAPRLLEDFEDGNFWTPETTLGWWDSAGTQVYQRSQAGLPAPGTSGMSMRLTYDKNNDPWSLFAGAVAPENPMRDFSQSSRLTVWVNAQEVSTAQIMVILRDRTMREVEVGTQTASGDWVKLTFIYSGVQEIDLTDIDNIFFIVDPGNPSSSGTLYIDHIMLE